ncbi:BTAD domain-containing putative transcriptional regulator [Streptomyces sp. NPDC058783]|uniref:AfsR/SARP family transcriptional regulator n=1 Tax=unclassified Streptomyces TaxID=2593676 RepID=UPI0026EFA7D0|nr:BTAD domain-containing putative transcriptional regulator [Streptomyces sp. HUAS CX7]WKX23643.1 BTAD domain-containing putative transcriptional regulator [Streptomyces sp. HUAS CX7]
MKFRLLGPLQIADGAKWKPIRASQQRAVLALLLLKAGHIVPIDRIIDDLWGDRPPRTAANTVHAYVMRLRRGLGKDLGRRLVTRSPGGYQMDVAARDLDVGMFEFLVGQGQEDMIAQRWASASDRLTRALDLWSGPTLADVPLTPAIRDGQAWLEQRRLIAVEARLDAVLELGRHAEVVSDLDILVSQHPLHENLRRRLMLALHRCGRRAEALEVYRQGRTVLIDELGIEPAQELRELQQTILRDDLALTATLPRGFRHVVNLARTNAVLADTNGAKRGSRAPATPGRDEEDHVQAPQKMDTEQVCTLPPDIADFTGRDEQVRLLGSLLTRSNRPTARAVTAICGRGGIGKTALAVHVAHRLHGYFPDGQLYVDLHGTSPDDAAAPGDVLARLLVALGVSSRTLPASMDERAERYRALVSRRRLLVVLDNVADERQILPLLPGRPHSAVLVTSRRRLRWLGTRRLDLDVLEPAAAHTLLAWIVGAERVARETEAAETISRLCEGVPLAVRMAGGRLAARPHWTLARLAMRMANERQRLDELSEDGVGVRASLDLSYERLDAVSQSLFKALGQLAGPGFAAWVPAALGIPAEEVETHLDSLIDAQLLTWVGTDSLGQNRYRLPDLERLYARERAEKEDNTSEARTRTFTRALGA